jgi:hypothetical protein
MQEILTALGAGMLAGAAVGRRSLRPAPPS